MNEPFYATMKLVTGEEILAEVCHEIDHDQESDFFTVFNPIIVEEMTKVDPRRGVMMSGLVPKKWMTYSGDDLTIIQKNHVVSVSELDKFGVDFYQNALKVARISSPIKKNIKTSDNTGYVGNVNTARDRLEKLFNID